MGRRVVITGMGAVTSLGLTVDAIWDGVLNGRSGVGHIRQFDSRAFPIAIGSEVDIDRVDPMPHGTGRTIRFGMHAAQHAWEDAGLRHAALDRSRCGVCVGASTFPVIEDRFDRLGDVLTARGWDIAKYIELCRDRPELLAQSDAASISGRMSREFGFTGPSLTIQAACTSATQALGHAFETISRGSLDVVLAGGTDSMLSMMCVTGFTLLGSLSKRWDRPDQASRPFDRTRDGFVAGEGAAMLFLEDLETARARGARIHAEIVGYGSSCDAYRFTDGHPEGSGIALSMERALATAAMEPSEVRYINAHGTSTPINDRCETKAIRRVFGKHAERLPVSSTKSQLGHLLCAAGAIELLLAAMAVQRGVLPPTVNLNHPDPECDLDYIPWTPRSADVPVAMSNSCGFGGQNGSIVLRRWDERARATKRHREPQPRVLVTGIGLVSPLGSTARKHFTRLLRGESGIMPCDAATLPYPYEARVADFDRRRFIANRMLRKILTRAASFAVLAARQSLKDAGIRGNDAALKSCGIYVGSPGLDQDFNVFLNGLRASMHGEHFDPALFAARGMAMIDPLFLVKSLPNSGLCGISIELGIHGPNLNVMNGPTSALQAIGAAAAAIRNGSAVHALAGGYDSLFQLEVAVAHTIAGSSSAPGEGAGFLLLEREDAAIARGARIYGEIVDDAAACCASPTLPIADAVFGDCSPVTGFCGVAGGAFSAIHAVLAVAGFNKKQKPARASAWCSDSAGKSASILLERYRPLANSRSASTEE